MRAVALFSLVGMASAGCDVCSSGKNRPTSLTLEYMGNTPGSNSQQQVNLGARVVPTRKSGSLGLAGLYTSSDGV